LVAHETLDEKLHSASEVARTRHLLDRFGQALEIARPG
jgi:hypothetical protein